METATSTLLVLHIIAGYVSLLAGLVSMLAQKGQRVHRQSGKIFFFSLLGVTATAIFLAAVMSSEFLLFVGIFVFYQNYSGWKALRDKTLRPDWADWLILAIAFVNGLLMLRTQQIVLLVFGGISMLLVLGSLSIYYRVLNGKPLPKMRWLTRHLGMMMGAYIGTITAFLVVNIKWVAPAWVVWLAPTAILLPLMFFWTRKYGRPSTTIS